jgi:hypothetical protein
MTLPGTFDNEIGGICKKELEMFSTEKNGL